jgi:TonB family protein
MKRSNPTQTFALCTALVVHLLGMSGMAWWYVHTTPNPYLPPLDKWKILALIPTMAKPVQPVQPPPPPAPKKQQQPPPPPPKPKAHPIPKPDDRNDPLKDDSGEDNTHGTANRSSPGEKPMQARQSALEQADLMRALLRDKLLIDPAAPNPAAAGEIDGSNDPRQLASSAGVQQPDFVEKSEATPQADPSLPMTARKPEGPGPMPRQNALKENRPAPTGTSTPTPNAKPTATTENKAPARAVRGRLAAPSDTDSAPFAREASFDFKNGRMVARDGLKVKFAQPRFLDASTNDLMMMGSTEIVLQVEIDPSGQTDNAEVTKSSGSSNVDQDVKICMYACEFAPAKDKDGHPKRTVWTVTLHLI